MDTAIDSANSQGPAAIALSGKQRTCVVARLSGGLGNQMFQYAAGRALALKTGSRLVLDATAFTLPTERRTFALDGYRLVAEVSFAGYAHQPVKAVIRFPPSRRYRWIDGAAQLLRVTIGPVGREAREKTFYVFTEKSFDFDARFCRRGAQTYLVGYWQSERYFAGVADLIREELTYVRAPNATNAGWLARISTANAVCVHVRRGDYLLGPHFEHHGVCSADYYRRAMRLMRERAPGPQFFVFSDDWRWCREHLAGADTVIVDANAPGAVQDELRLMAACRHHVIANSSLSWWAAWLSTGHRQVVVGPQPWFAMTTLTPDLFPRGWLVLPRD